MKPILTLPAADEDVLEAVAYYDHESAELGTAFTKEVQAALNLIAERPEAWPHFYGNLRKLMIHRFPYRILYQNRENIVIVIGVMHLKRRPGKWFKRVRGI